MEDVASEIGKLIDLVKVPGFVADPKMLGELTHRLEVARLQYIELIQLNERCLNGDPLRMEIDFNQETGVLSCRSGSSGKNIFNMKLRRADPNVPVQLRGMSDMIMFSFGKEDGEGNSGLEGDRKKLAEKLESFYYNAGKLWDLVEKSICGKKKAEFIGVKMVRNRLIEHTEDGDIYSFGVSEAWGPTVKPSQSTKRKERGWHDKGLKVNTQELISKIRQRLTVRDAMLLEPN